MGRQRKRSSKHFGLLDAILILFIISGTCLSIQTLGSSQARMAPNNIAVTALARLWFAWRRGWVQQLMRPTTTNATTPAITQTSQPSTAPSPVLPSDVPEGLPEPYVVMIPRNSAWQPGVAVSLLRALQEKARQGAWKLRVSASSTGVQWVMWYLPNRGQRALSEADMTNVVQAFYPSAQVKAVPHVPFDLPLYRRVMVFGREPGHFFAQALSASEIHAGRDPLAVLAQTMNGLQPGETLKFEVNIISLVELEQEDIEEALTISAYDAGYRYRSSAAYRQDLTELAIGSAIGWLRSQSLKDERVMAFSEAETRRYLEKLRQPLFLTQLALQFDTPDARRLDVFDSAASAIRGLSNPAYQIIDGQVAHTTTLNEIEEWIQTDAYSSFEAAVARTGTEAVQEALYNAHTFFYTAEELAAVWHLPHSEFTASGIAWTQAGQVEIPAALRTVTEGIQMGVNRFGQHEHVVRLPQTNRIIPTTIIGKPGTGKSSLVHHMIHDDIASGRGLCLIDPKGTLVSRVLQHSIPEGRENDVVMVDVQTPVRGEFHPPPLNIMGNSVEVAEDIAAGQLMTVLDRLFDGFTDHRMADTLNMTLLALAAKPDATILDVYYFLSDPRFRETALARVLDPLVQTHWHTFNGYREGQQKALADPILWRLRSFFNNKHLRAMTCQPRHLDLAGLIAANKIILVSLAASERLIPERERYVLGAYLVSQIDLVAREGIIGEHPFMLYIDEAQNFVSTALPQMLSQLREYRLGLVLVNQYYRQLFGDTFDAIEGTAAAIIGFEVGKRDADLLASYMRPEFSADDFMALGQYRAAVSLVHGNSRQRPFTLQTLPPPGYGLENREREIHLRQRAVENLGLRPYSEVIDALHSRYGSTAQLPAKPSADRDDEYFE